jgi:hypothetical protein
MKTLRHTSIATDGDLVERVERQQRRRATMGLTVARHTNILALAAALLFALGALATTTAFQLRPASSEVRAPAPIAVAAPWTGTCRSDVAGCVPDEEFSVPASAPVAVAAPHTGTCRSDVAGCVPEEQIVPGVPAAIPAAWTGTCRAGSSGCEPDEELIPGVPAAIPAAYTGPCRSDIVGCVPDEVFIPGVGPVSR